MTLTCPRCHRQVTLRLIPSMVKGQLTIAYRTDPHICPRPKNAPPPKAPATIFAISTPVEKAA